MNQLKIHATTICICFDTNALFALSRQIDVKSMHVNILSTQADTEASDFTKNGGLAPTSSDICCHLSPVCRTQMSPSRNRRHRFQRLREGGNGLRKIKSSDDLNPSAPVPCISCLMQGISCSYYSSLVTTTPQKLLSNT